MKLKHLYQVLSTILTIFIVIPLTTFSTNAIDYYGDDDYQDKGLNGGDTAYTYSSSWNIYRQGNVGADCNRVHVIAKPLTNNIYNTENVNLPNVEKASHCLSFEVSINNRGFNALFGASLFNTFADKRIQCSMTIDDYNKIKNDQSKNNALWIMNDHLMQSLQIATNNNLRIYGHGYPGPKACEEKNGNVMDDAVGVVVNGRLKIINKIYDSMPFNFLFGDNPNFKLYRGHEDVNNSEKKVLIGTCYFENNQNCSINRNAEREDPKLLYEDAATLNLLRSDYYFKSNVNEYSKRWGIKYKLATIIKTIRKTCEITIFNKNCDSYGARNIRVSTTYTISNVKNGVANYTYRATPPTVNVTKFNPVIGTIAQDSNTIKFANESLPGTVGNIDPTMFASSTNATTFDNNKPGLNFTAQDKNKNYGLPPSVTFERDSLPVQGSNGYMVPPSILNSNSIVGKLESYNSTWNGRNQLPYEYHGKVSGIHNYTPVIKGSISGPSNVIDFNGTEIRSGSNMRYDFINRRSNISVKSISAGNYSLGDGAGSNYWTTNYTSGKFFQYGTDFAVYINSIEGDYVVQHTNLCNQYIGMASVYNSQPILRMNIPVFTAQLYR